MKFYPIGETVIVEIEEHRKKYKYTSWTIGITNDNKRRKEEHKNDGKSLGFWKDWKANSEQIARNVEKYFLEKGMKGGGGGGDNPTFVYVF